MDAYRGDVLPIYCVCVYMYVCMYMYMYIYIYIVESNSFGTSICSGTCVIEQVTYLVNHVEIQ